jgi:anti-sigma factor RsiW
MTAPIGEDDLMAWVDRRLPVERRAIVDTYLGENPNVARRLGLQAEQRAALANMFAPVAAEPIPSAMRVSAITSRRRAGPQRWQGIAAALLLAIGFGGGWGMRSSTLPPHAGIGALAQEATDNYRVYAVDAHRGAELGPQAQAQLVSWASARLGSRVAVPDLAAAGYRFAGGRLVATPHGPAVMFLYDGPSLTRLALMTRPMEIDKAARMTESADGDLGRVSWADRGIGFSIVATRPSAELQSVAETVRRQSLRV